MWRLRGYIALDRGALELMAAHRDSWTDVFQPHVVPNWEFAHRAGWPMEWSAKFVPVHGLYDSTHTWRLMVRGLTRSVTTFALTRDGYLQHEDATCIRANEFDGRASLRPLLLPLLVRNEYPLCPWCGLPTEYARGGADWCQAHEAPIPMEGVSVYSQQPRIDLW